MNFEIEHLENNKYSVMINGEYYVFIDLAKESFEYEENFENELSENEENNIYDDVLDFHKDRIESEAEAEERNSDPYNFYGINRSDFI